MTDKVETKPKQETPKFTTKIGNTTYEVYIHFSKTSTENMNDKILRLIKNDVANTQ